MGHVADACQSTSHDNSGSYDGGDSEVKMTRLATGALRRPQRRIKTRSSASSKEAVRRLTAASRVKPETGMARDGQRNSARLGLGAGNLQSRKRILRLRRK
jgi:hypothetical protein